MFNRSFIAKRGWLTRKNLESSRPESALGKEHYYVHNLREQKVAIIPLLVKWLASGVIACRLTMGRGRRYAQRGRRATVTPRALEGHWPARSRTHLTRIDLVLCCTALPYLSYPNGTSMWTLGLNECRLFVILGLIMCYETISRRFNKYLLFLENTIR